MSTNEIDGKVSDIGPLKDASGFTFNVNFLQYDTFVGDSSERKDIRANFIRTSIYLHQKIILATALKLAKEDLDKYIKTVKEQIKEFEGGLK